MTAPLLLALICAVLLFQLAVGIGVALWRRRAAAKAVFSVGLGRIPPVSEGAWPGWREFRVARREFEDAARTQCSFYLEPNDGGRLLPFKPGQFLTFTIRLADASPEFQRPDRRITRCYSISDRPDENYYRVTIKRVSPPQGRPDLPPGVASNQFHDHIQEGDILEAKAPSGHFFIDSDLNTPAILIAGGIGITPMMSMLRWSLAEQPERTIHLYYGVRNSAEHAFKQTLEQFAGSHPNFHLNVVYSRPGAQDVEGVDFHHAGHIDIDLLQRTLPQGRRQFYVCGPSLMMESLVPALGRWGVLKEDIHYEAFGPASVGPSSGLSNNAEAKMTTPVEVRFRRAGRTLTWDGQDANLLDFAERHGVAVDSGCRSGSCGTCETKMISGTVSYADAPDYDAAPNHCLLCVATPETNLVIEA